MAKFFHVPKNRRFAFKPRYYSEKDAIRKEREERIKKEVEAEKLGKPSGISKEDLTNYIKIARRTQKKSNTRLLVILIILILLFILLLK